MRSRFAQLLLSTAVAITVSPFGPYAWAHAHPTAMTPAADATIASPSVVSVTFSEPLEPKFSSLTLSTQDGKKLSAPSAAPAHGDPKTLILPLPAALSSGTYTVRWVSVATDGHRMEGSYKFKVK